MSRARVAYSPESSLEPAPAAVRGRGGAFHQAHRHSRLVRVLRIALPVAVFLAAALIAFTLWLDPLRALRDLPVEFSRISLSGNKLTIDAPRLTGFTQDARPYSVTAQSAAQDLAQPNLVELTGIVGLVELPNRGETDMRATNGLYDIKAENLRLSGGIEIRATGGYHIWLKDAFVEVRQGRITTDNPINAIFPDGTLQANQLRIFDHGARVIFDGGVVMTLKMPEEPASETADVQQ